jgi:hypothetical protein
VEPDFHNFYVLVGLGYPADPCITTKSIGSLAWTEGTHHSGRKTQLSKEKGIVNLFFFIIIPP